MDVSELSQLADEIRPYITGVVSGREVTFLLTSESLN